MVDASGPVDAMRARMHFVHNATLDIVESTSGGIVLASPDEVGMWARLADEMLGAFGKKVWLLIDLRGLAVRPPASAAFGIARARLLERHVFASVRFGADPWTGVAVNVSALVHQTHGNVFDTREQALACLLDLRRVMTDL